jgi:hypothetical protein
VPMLKDDRAVGVISLYGQRYGPSPTNRSNC